MLRELFERVGFGWAVRVLSLVMLVTLGVSLMLLRPQKRNERRGRMFDMGMLRDGSYTLFILGELMSGGEK
jgi:hypothetical protein